MQTKQDNNTIETRPEFGVKRLTSAAIDALERKYGKRKGWRRLPVSNFLLSINTNMHSGDCFANCDMDARLYQWTSPIVTAIRAGINHLFYGKRL